MRADFANGFVDITAIEKLALSRPDAQGEADGFAVAVGEKYDSVPGVGIESSDSDVVRTEIGRRGREENAG